MSNEVTGKGIYTPLDSSRHEIRLLTILPGVWASQIHCRMHSFSLDLAPVYQTLSYTWGDRATSGQVLLNGEPKKVTINLERALRSLRQRHVGLLWADALCINQSNNAEKSSQVQLMREIYKSTEHVWIWLGEEEGEISENTAFEVIELMSSNEHLNGEVSVSALNAMVQLMQRPWWNRTWVIQECILPPEGCFLLGGSEPFPISKARRAARNYYRHAASCCLESYARLPKAIGDGLSSFARALNSIDGIPTLHETYNNELVTKTLTELLWNFRSHKASNPLDKVYGLLGLLDPSLTRHVINPDYSLTRKQLFSQVVVNLIESERSLHILLCDCGRASSNDLPSWAHDWTEPSTKIQESYGIERLAMLIHYDFFKASKSKFPEMRFLDDRILSLQGIFVDTIVSVGDCIDETTASSSSAIASTLNQWKEVLPSQDYPAGGTYQDAFWRTTFINLLLEVQELDQNRKIFEPRAARSSDEKVWNFFQANLNGMEPAADDTDYTVNHAHLSEGQIGLFFRMATMGRRYFISNEGYIGLAPSTALPGDHVYILFGGSVPFVLRSCDTGNTFSKDELDTARRHHQLIGDCYMHGIMNGEVLDDYRSDRADWCFLV